MVKITHIGLIQENEDDRNVTTEGIKVVSTQYPG